MLVTGSIQTCRRIRTRRRREGHLTGLVVLQHLHHPPDENFSSSLPNPSPNLSYCPFDPTLTFKGGGFIPQWWEPGVKSTEVLLPTQLVAKAFP